MNVNHLYISTVSIIKRRLLLSSKLYSSTVFPCCRCLSEQKGTRQMEWKRCTGIVDTPLCQFDNGRQRLIKQSKIYNADFAERIYYIIKKQNHS